MSFATSEPTSRSSSTPCTACRAACLRLRPDQVGPHAPPPPAAVSWLHVAYPLPCASLPPLSMAPSAVGAAGDAPPPADYQQLLDGLGEQIRMLRTMDPPT